MEQKRLGSPKRANWIRIQSSDAEGSASITGSQSGPSQDCVPEGSAGEQSVSLGLQLVAPNPPTQGDGLASFTIPPTESDVKTMEFLQARKDFSNWHLTAFKVWHYTNRVALFKLRCASSRTERHAELSYEWSKLSDEEKRPYFEVAHKLNIKQKQRLTECEPKNKRSAENLNSGCGAGQRASQGAGHEVPQAAGCPPPQAAGCPPPQASGCPPPQASGFPSPQAAGCPPPQASGCPPPQAARFPPPQAAGFPGFPPPQAARFPPPQAAGFPGFPLPQAAGFPQPQAAGFPQPQAAGFPGFPTPQVARHQASTAAGSAPSQTVARPAASRAVKRAAERYAPSQAAGHQPSQAAGYAASQASFFMSQAVPPVPSSLYYPSMYPVFPMMPYSLDCYSCPPFYQYYLPDQHSWAEPRHSSLYNRFPSASPSLQAGWNTRVVDVPAGSTAQTGAGSRMAERNTFPSDVSQQAVRSSTATSEPEPVTAKETENSFREEIDVIGL